MSSFDQSPVEGSPPDGPEAFKRETIRITPMRVGLVVLAVFALIFIVQNGDRVDFRLIVFRADQVPLWMVIVIAMAIGFLLGMLFTTIRRRRGERADRRDPKE